MRISLIKYFVTKLEFSQTYSTNISKIERRQKGAAVMHYFCLRRPNSCMRCWWSSLWYFFRLIFPKHVFSTLHVTGVFIDELFILYMVLLTERAKLNIADALPETLALVFECLGCGDPHILDKLATTPRAFLPSNVQYF